MYLAHASPYIIAAACNVERSCLLKRVLLLATKAIPKLSLVQPSICLLQHIKQAFQFHAQVRIDTPLLARRRNLSARCRLRIGPAKKEQYHHEHHTNTLERKSSGKNVFHNLAKTVCTFPQCVYIF
jgi:hypothetical protein